jgi:hypothetical protein
VTQPDPMEELLNRLLRKYRLVAGKVEPGQGEGAGRRPQPASRPPLQLDPVSEMHSFERSLDYHEVQFDRILHRTKRIDITDRTGYTCPHCETGKLVGWVRDDDPEDLDRTIKPDEVVCLNWQAEAHLQPPHGEGWPYRWGRDEWARLGVRVGARDDQRYGPRLPNAGVG